MCTHTEREREDVTNIYRIDRRKAEFYIITDCKWRNAFLSNV